MKNFDSRTYSINDFREWHDREQLELVPKFQRRDVWSQNARSYLMDSVIRGKPIPKIFLRQSTNPQSKKTVREVVDGQQRLRTIFGFLEDGFKISKTHNSKYGGKVFSQLPTSVQKEILEYEIAVDLLLDAPDQSVLDVFARINSYSVTLSNQELRHAKYFGEFRQTVYRLAIEYLTFWTEHKILTDKQILRMSEAELTSELLIAMSDGIQSKKTVDSYYKEYDTKFPKKKLMIKRFKDTMDFIGVLLSETLKTSNFKRQHLFYTLFCSIYHMLYGIPRFTVKRVHIGKSEIPKIRVALEEVDQIFQKDTDDLTKKEKEFLEKSRRATTDASVRKDRSKYVCKLISNTLRENTLYGA